MAKDVELVVRAKDAATKAIDNIKDALSDLTGVQNEVAKSAGKTDTLLGQLGQQLRTLTREAANVASVGKIATELDKAGAAVGRLESNLRGGVSEFARLARESETAATNAARLRGQIEAEQKAIRENTAERVAARKALADANREVKAAERNQERLNKAIAATPDVKVTSAKRSASAFIASDLEASRAAQAQLSRDVAQYQSNIERSRQAVQTLQPQLRAASTEQGKLAAETERAADSLAKQRNDLGRARSELSQIEGVASEAGAALGGLAVNQDKVAVAAARMAAQLAQTKARLDTLQSAPKVSATVDTSGLETQRRAYLEARREWSAAQAEVKRLAQAMRDAGTPTTELATAFGQAQAQARLAKDAYLQQRSALSQLGGAAQGGFRAFEQAAQRMQQTAAAMRPIALGASVVDTSLERTAGRAQRFAQSVRSAGDGARQSASSFQTLHGSVLGLASAFGGLYAAGHQVAGILKSFQSVEAAQSRLGVVFGGDQERVGKELDFIGRQAQRLGVQFSVVSDQYGKFAVAAQAANFSAEDTRKIFLSVAEAGRVNRLSTEDLSGTFLALTQMISKGKVTAEELRGQLGERLTGAFNIFADAIGVTTAELDAMLQKGEVIANKSTLLAFATELDKRFGSQLAKALEGTTAEIGKFANNVEQAQLQVARGGFIESFTAGLQKLNAYFRSQDGTQFFLSVGAALGRFTDGVVLLVENLGTVKNALLAIVGIKVGSYFAASLASLRAGLAGITTAAGIAAGAFRALWAAVGGLPGIAFGAITLAVGKWAGSVNSATSALAEHERQLQAVQTAYDETKGKVEDWGQAVKDVTLSQAKAALVSLQAAQEDLLGSLDEQIKFVRAAVDSYNGVAGALKRGQTDPSLASGFEAIVAAVDKLKTGRLTVAQFKQAMDDLALSTKNTDIQDIAVNLQNFLKQADESGQSIEGVTKAIGVQEKIIKLLGDTTGKTAGTLLDMVRVQDDAAGSTDKLTESSNAFADKLGEINKLVPSMADELKRLEEIDAINKLYRDAAALATTMSQVNALTNQANAAIAGINDRYTNFEAVYTERRGTPAGRDDETLVREVSKLAEQLGLSAKDLLTAISYETGGTLNPGIRGGAGGNYEGLIQFGPEARARYGVSASSSIEEQVAAAGKYLTDAGVKAGDGLLQIYAAINAGSADRINASDAANGGRPGTVLDKVQTDMEGHKARAEGLLATYQGLTAEQKKQADEEQRAREKAQQYNADLENCISLMRDEVDNAGKLSREGFVQKALEAEKRRAREAGVTLGQQEIAQITELAGKQFDLKQTAVGQTATIKDANVALQQVLALLAEQSTLEQQIAAARRMGDGGKADEYQARLTVLNDKLREAIDLARGMWKSIGGPQADVALTKIATAETKAQQATEQMGLFGLSAQTTQSLVGSFVDGFVGVFDQFAQAIANGENGFKALGKAALQFTANFLRELGTVILRTLALRAIMTAFGAANPIGAAAGSLLGGVATGHTGGVVGASFIGIGNSLHRPIDVAAVRSTIMRYHDGGVVKKLAPMEVPAVLEVGEEVLTKKDPRHRTNGGLQKGEGPSAQIIKQVLAFTPEEIANAMNNSHGEKVVVTFIKRNAAQIKRMLG